MRRVVTRLSRAVDRFAPTRRASRHDLVLAVIPAAFALAALLGATLPVDTTTAVAGGAGVSGIAVVDALFLNPPRGPGAAGAAP